MDELLGSHFTDAALADDSRWIRRHHKDDPTPDIRIRAMAQIFLAEGAVERDVLQETFGGRVTLVWYVNLSTGSHERDHALLLAKSFLDMKRFPRTCFLILRHAHS